MGRPPKFTKDVQRLYLGGLMRGLSREGAARQAGVSSRAVRTYLQYNPEFRQEIEEAERGADDVIVRAVFEKARDGDMNAAKFWLTNRRPDQWHKDGMAPKEIALAVEVAQPVEYATFTPEQWAEILAAEPPAD